MADCQTFLTAIPFPGTSPAPDIELMVLWFLCLMCLATGMGWLAAPIWPNFSQALSRIEERKVHSVTLTLRELEETLQSGRLPSAQQWQSLDQLPAPWGLLASQSIQSLRTRGAALLPTLARLRSLSEDHAVSLADAKARSSQALTQAWICVGLVPLMGWILNNLLPGVNERLGVWISACSIAVLWASVGGAWMFQQALQARWGGLRSIRRHWSLASLVAGECFLAFLRAGTPPDLAWNQALEQLSHSAADLSELWGYSVWREDRPQAVVGLSERVIAEHGPAIKRSIQVSLMEGRPCSERIEAALTALKLELRAQRDRELNLLPTRTLKPLFLCVAPAIFSILIVGLYLGWKQASAGIF